MTAFEEFGVMPELGAAVDEMGWTLPTDVQVEWSTLSGLSNVSLLYIDIRNSAQTDSTKVQNLIIGQNVEENHAERTLGFLILLIPVLFGQMIDLDSFTDLVWTKIKYLPIIDFE